MKEDENNNKNKLSNNIFVDQICDSKENTVHLHVADIVHLSERTC